MATPQQINAITALYVGYFDRAPDPAGLQFWIDQLSAGREFNTIAADFAASPEAQALYPYLVTPGVSTPSAFITSVYMNMFNRAPDAEGLAFWTGVLGDGSVSVADMIEAIINGAQDGSVDKATLDNKVVVGLDFAADAGDMPNFTFDAAAKLAAIAVLDGVTDDVATVDAAKAATDAYFAGNGETFTLTTATDSGAAFVGSDADSTFNAQLGLGIDGLVGVQTLQGPDVLDGGAGFDKLNAELNGTGTTANPTISNIEQYNLTSFNNIFGSGQLDLNRATGYEQLWNRNSRADLDLYNVGEAAILGLDNVRDGSEYYVEYDTVAIETQTVVATRTGRDFESDVRLDIRGVDGLIGTLDLQVSNGVYLELQNDADGVENLKISGDGALRLSGNNDFANLQTLDATGYNENLTLDVSGSADLTSVLTGDGDDEIIVGGASVNGGLSVDLGAGANILAVDDVSGESDVNALDFTGGIANVQTLAMVEDISLSGGATLDLDGFDDQLATIAVKDFAANGNGFTILTAPEVLEITAAEEFEMSGGLFTIEGVVDLTMTSTGAPGADSDIRLDGGVNSETLVTLSIEAADDAELDLFGGTDALTTVNVVALGDDADVDMSVLGALGSGDEFAALTTVNVTAAADATLNMTGRGGVVAFAGTQATQSFTIDVTAGASYGGGGFFRDSAGNVVFNSSDVPSGVVNTTYSTTVGFFGTANNAGHDTGAASDIAAGLDALAELTATNSGKVVNVTWANVGIVDDLNYLSGAATSGTLDSVTPGLFTQGSAAIAQVDGEGFEAVETITVDAQDGDADVDLMDVYGAFTLTVTATDDADVDLFNTNATSVTVTAGMDLGDKATVDIDGDTVGNADLVNLTVSGDAADVTLADDLASFTTLDVSGVVTNLVADTSTAEFVVSAGQYVEYQIGATQDGTAALDVDFTGNAIREVYNFVGADIGEVEINNFTWGADPAVGDRLDVSAFANGAGQLVFTDVGADLVISDLAGGMGDFGGSITIVGAAGQDLSFNLIYA